MTDTLAQKVKAIVAETFNAAESDITDATVAADIDGWDSLSHTLLMVRLQKHLGVAITEEVAVSAATVGDLIEALRRLGAASSP